MRSSILACLYCLSALFSTCSGAANTFHWTDEEYQLLFGDFDGDGQPDSLIVAKRPSLTTILYSNHADTPTESRHDVSFDPQTEYLVVGDFDNDGMDEILVLAADLTGHYWDYSQETGFIEGEQKLRIKGYNENRRIDFTHLYRGDFNGDGSDDLLAYAQQNQDVVVFHNRNSDKKVKFRFDAQLELANTSRLSPLISDFNGDGLEDIALLSTVHGGKSFVAFAGKKGKFKKSDFEDITPYLGGEDWSLDQHSIINWQNPLTGENMILRLANAPGGVDEDGNVWASDDDLPQYDEWFDPIRPPEGEDTGNATRQSQSKEETSTCRDLVYSPLHQTVSAVCYEDGSASQSLFSVGASSQQSLSRLPQHKHPKFNTIVIPVAGCGASDSTFSEKNSNVEKAACLSYSKRPRAPSYQPDIEGGHYHLINTDYTVLLHHVDQTIYYNIYIGTEPGSIHPARNTSHLTEDFNTGPDHGFRYIEYEACNNRGCSGRSPWRRIKVFDVPGPVKNLRSNYTSNTRKGGIAVYFDRAGGVVNGGHYDIYETLAGQPERLYRTMDAGSGSSVFNYAFMTRPEHPGAYTYKIRACNPGTTCGGSQWINLTFTNQRPIAFDHSSSVDEGQAIDINVYHRAEDLDGDSINLASYGQGNYGSVSCSGGVCTYTASENISSNVTDSFTYVIQDEYGAKSVPRTVTVSIRNLSEGPAATPQISPAGGNFTGSQTVSISSTTPGATIYYTTNGSNPGTSSARYTAPLTLTESTTIKALAVANDYTNSSIVTQTFTKVVQQRRIVYIHTDALGSPASETDENGNGQ